MGKAFSMFGHSSARSRLSLLLILLLAFALRLHQLGAQSLWYDETVSVHLAGKPASSLVAHTARDIHPPGYYLMLRGWLLLSGYPSGHADPDSQGLEFTAAFLSVCFGILVTALVYLVGRALYDEGVALLASALIAASPFHIWYSQEVRMYTLGATLGLLCLAAAIRFVGGRERLPAASRAQGLVVYVLAATAGLYIMYYFAFLLVALNLWVIGALCYARICGGPRSPEVPAAAKPRRSGAQGSPARTGSRRSSPGLLRWLLAQGLVLALYLPWLPIAWRQATDPPVPPWRSFTGLWQMVIETWRALSFGQSIGLESAWPFLVLTALLFVGGVLAWTRRRERPANKETVGRAKLPGGAAVAAIHSLGPMAMIWGASLLTPLYHVRYAFTYAPPFHLVLAAGIMALARWRRWARPLAVMLVVLLLAISGVSLRNLWTDPAYAADDHRAAADFLSEQWRAGDVILVNAGYGYTALVTYIQQPIDWQGRLSDYSARKSPDEGVTIVQTGHIDGDPDLGWGDPESDFYTLPYDLAAEKIALLFDTHPRLWHYRIYDTVNDPEGSLRELLAASGVIFEDRVFSGEANMRVQGYLPQQRLLMPPEGAGVAGYGDMFTLHVAPCCGTAEAGQTVGADLFWQVRRQPEADYATSLRLVGQQGRLWAQP
ncbi:MAG TPA: glycosyltransferase family 39 protein, partial [Anaerolineae bacterium]|nr:glycosyltransferase family 39 protein [Anaerolineae bacterium]